ncbi:hypothetical protein [Holospora curviuscula]|uniref:Uncharacterized protein n=1 Tax=Holospora curviuscula TaxID=1082868 RepID=A0A2S5RHZ6_9PROT|nr:hypothetical protein [Holospora curviuscula]PPE06954.1 hypothetical protein HCUR_00017 [Holospora curviuscula]
MSYEHSGKRFGMGKQAVYRGSARLEPNLVRSKSPSTMDMECLEHDITMDLLMPIIQRKRSALGLGQLAF